ncbi:hypothetical protein CYMTET_35221, partial [Cymbomonas tetramitiformis]
MLGNGNGQHGRDTDKYGNPIPKLSLKSALYLNKDTPISRRPGFKRPSDGEDPNATRHTVLRPRLLPTLSPTRRQSGPRAKGAAGPGIRFTAAEPRHVGGDLGVCGRSEARRR